MHTTEAKLENRLTRGLCTLVAASAAWFTPAFANASMTYPAALVASEQYANFSLDCLLCHATIAGGVATTPFALHLKQNFGLVGGSNNAALISAFDQAAAAMTDVDADGSLDIDEVLGGGNPNDPNVKVGAEAPRAVTEYGCVGTLAGKQSSTDGAALTAAALAALVLVLKRRR